MVKTLIRGVYMIKKIIILTFCISANFLSASENGVIVIEKPSQIGKYQLSIIDGPHTLPSMYLFDTETGTIWMAKGKNT